MISNKYDEGYNAGLKQRGEHSHINYYGKTKTVTATELDHGRGDACAHRPRDPSKSVVANDPKYKTFLDKVAEALEWGALHRGEIISVDWCTGGMTGGSCYGTSPDTAVDSDPPEELKDLDKIIEAVAPDISFMKYKSICNEVLFTATYCDSSDYYGNYYNHATKYILLPELYRALCSRGVI